MYNICRLDSSFKKSFFYFLSGFLECKRKLSFTKENFNKLENNQYKLLWLLYYITKIK